MRFKDDAKAKKVKDGSQKEEVCSREVEDPFSSEPRCRETICRTPFEILKGSVLRYDDPTGSVFDGDD